ncbi:uncharacterized membrane protein YjjB (DUF3815 family) [Allocatelliglobosispora scoriae]|uniref:Uncharacterized membrane protein YjjB (DUF3815 family) n=1 Tax=Allocatelliglobosispora scoriae TaxID=643052 RepID=A0A841C475_9ACTN|nr:hypothetical protein [Allocatelliglobosispora scoriae]MBB5873770.1 uncharacterized membrane protein YjjB (DUF3815 family) [Allocatelliglobosispora scoriae]
MASMSPNRLATYVLAATTVLMALIAVLLTPTAYDVIADPGGAVDGESTGFTFLFTVFVISQAVAVLSAATAVVLVVRNKAHYAKRAMEVATVTGFIPTIVPGLLALVGRVVLGRSTR